MAETIVLTPEILWFPEIHGLAVILFISEVVGVVVAAATSMMFLGEA